MLQVSVNNLLLQLLDNIKTPSTDVFSNLLVTYIPWTNVYSHCMYVYVYHSIAKQLEFVEDLLNLHHAY